MIRSNKPALPIPEPIRGREPGTWACATISGRLPEIAARILRENELPDTADAAIERLIHDMPHAPIHLVDEPEAPDAADWRDYILPYVGWNWLDPPWFFVESYFYRRVLEATGYFHPGPFRGYDPFQYSKEQGLTASEWPVAALAARLEEWNGEWQAEVFASLLSIALWGNQGDLSLWPADAIDRPDHDDPLQAGAHILADDTAAVFDHLVEQFGGRVDLVTDNAGYEFVADLGLVDYLLATGAAARVVLNVKAHPYFVSDVTRPDVAITLDWLAASGKGTTIRGFGQRLKDWEIAGRLRVQTHPYWTSPLAFWEMPAGIRRELTESSLLIFKGDANYRRLLGDRHWPFTTPFAAIVHDPPAPVLALRTLKAELAAGLQPEQVSRLDREEPEWMVNGRWGVIQFANAGK
jgi:uncharacterized protein with ATP-grasp and redox domains